MLRPAFYSSAVPYLFARAPGVAVPSLQERNGRCSKPSICGANAARQKAALGRVSTAGTKRVTSVHSRLFRLVSRPLSGVTLRACPAPGGRLALLLRLHHPIAQRTRAVDPDSAALRVTVSTCGGPSVNAELRPWEPGPLAGIRQG